MFALLLFAGITITERAEPLEPIVIQATDARFIRVRDNRRRVRFVLRRRLVREPVIIVEEVVQEKVKDE